MQARKRHFRRIEICTIKKHNNNFHEFNFAYFRDEFAVLVCVFASCVVCICVRLFVIVITVSYLN